LLDVGAVVRDGGDMRPSFIVLIERA
jgi:hypothetical protein